MRYCNRAVFLPDSKSLVIADLHLGQGIVDAVSYSVDSFQDDTARLTTLLEAHAPEEVIIAGDIVHAFSGIPQSVKEQLSELERILQKTGVDLTYVRGNHDTVLDSLTDIPLTSAYQPESTNILIMHGHEFQDSTADTYIIGHEHPAITIEGRKYPCFLKGPTADETGTVLILPSFSQLTPGTTMNSSLQTTIDSPIVSDLGAFSPIVYTADTDEVFQFPPLSVLGSEFSP